MSPDILRHVDDHVRRLKAKKPGGFKDGILDSTDVGRWERFAAERANDLSLVDTAENAAVADMAMAFLEIAKNEPNKARSHIYDTIAVLLEIDGKMIDEING